MIERAKWEGVDVEVQCRENSKDAFAVKLSGSLGTADDRKRDFYRRAPILSLIRLACSECHFIRASIPCDGSAVVFPLALGQLPYHYFVIYDPRLVWTDAGYRLEYTMICPRCRLERERFADHQFKEPEEQAASI